LRIRIQSDPFIIGSPGSGSIYYLRIQIRIEVWIQIRIQQLIYRPPIEKSRIFLTFFLNLNFVLVFPVFPPLLKTEPLKVRIVIVDCSVADLDNTWQEITDPDPDPDPTWQVITDPELDLIRIQIRILFESSYETF